MINLDATTWTIIGSVTLLVICYVLRRYRVGGHFEHPRRFSDIWDRAEREKGIWEK